MKKRKITYSLTAQQKKQLKRRQEGKIVEEEKEAPEVSAEAEATAVRKKNTTVIIVSVAVVFVAIALIFLALFALGVFNGDSEIVSKQTFLNWEYYNPDDPDHPYDTPKNPNPHATITLTGDGQAFKDIFGAEEVNIDIEIFMDDAPYAGTNFMYLAESGFYDGTIINNIARGQAWFGGYTDTKNASYRGADGTTMLKNLKGFVEHSSNVAGTDASTNDYKLGYRLRIESNRNPTDSTGGSLGYLAMISGHSSQYSASTMFMFMTAADPQLNLPTTNTSITSYLSWMGMANSTESREIIKKLNNVSTTLSGKYYAPNDNIRIKSIKTDLSKARKDYLLNNFESIIEGSETSWTFRPFNETYYGFAG